MKTLIISVKRRKPEWISACVQGKALRTAMYKLYINSIKATFRGTQRRYSSKPLNIALLKVF